MYTQTASITGSAIMNRTLKSDCWPLAGRRHRTRRHVGADGEIEDDVGHHGEDRPDDDQPAKVVSLGALAHATTLRNPSMYPTVCIGPPLP